MVLLQLLILCTLTCASPLLALSDCPSVEGKIWYGDFSLGERPDIDTIYNMVKSNEENNITPNEHYNSSTFSMDNHGRDLEYFYSKHSATFVTQETGNYTFYLTCDNTCMLLLNGVEVLRLNSFSQVGSWDQYPANQTYTKHLYASMCVSIVAIQAEGKVIDHLGVGVEYPNGTLDRPISEYICVPEGMCPCDNDNTCKNGETCVVTGLPPNGFTCECGEMGCCDTEENCKERCTDITAETVGLLSKECRRSCDFCCSCEATCDVMYQKVGCYNDSTVPFKRALPHLLLSNRENNMDWSNWFELLPQFVCECANAAAMGNYTYFGIQFYWECWAGNDSAKFMKYGFGAPNACRDREWHSCINSTRNEEVEVVDDYNHNMDSTVHSSPHYCCAGGACVNYIYKIPVLNQKVDACYLEP